MDETKVIALVNTAIDLPFVKIDRDEFLMKEFNSSSYQNMMQDILEKGPCKAGVPIDVIRKKCQDAINFETLKSTGISVAAGLPGGLAMIGTIPADTIQWMGHALRICQKLSYLAGFKADSLEEMEDGVADKYALFLGVMFGVQGAKGLLIKMTPHLAANVSKKIASAALTKTTWYPILKKILAQVGIKLTKQVAAKSVGKIIPVVGGVVSGLFTLATLKPMSKRLQETLIENLENE